MLNDSDKDRIYYDNDKSVSLIYVCMYILKYEFKHFLAQVLFTYFYLCFFQAGTSAIIADDDTALIGTPGKRRKKTVYF